MSHLAKKVVDDYQKKIKDLEEKLLEQQKQSKKNIQEYKKKIKYFEEKVSRGEKEIRSELEINYNRLTKKKVTFAKNDLIRKIALTHKLDIQKLAKLYLDSPKKPEKNKLKDDHLFEDPSIPGQVWCCLSITTPNTFKSNTNKKIYAIKFRGAFPNKNEAELYADELRELEPYFHIFVAEVGKWLPWDDDPQKAEKENYAEEEYNKMVKAHKKEWERTKIVHKERTNYLKKKNIKFQARQRRKNQKITMKKKLINMDSIKNQDKKLKSKEKQLKSRKKIINTKKKSLNKEKVEIERVDDQLRKARELLKKFK